jgi:phosphorylcholine metabolism protein LicD
MDEANITFGLIYGTLLGAVREKNFIAHDEDTDVFCFEVDRQSVLDILFKLKEVGLVVGRYQEEEDLISFVKNDEYIDIYFFRKNLLGNYVSNGSYFEAKYLENLIEIEFLGEQFSVPWQPEVLLEKLYGKDWRVPREDVKGANFGVYLTVRKFISEKSPVVFGIISRLKKLLH